MEDGAGGYYDKHDKRILKENQVITIEPFISSGAREVFDSGDGWTLVQREYFTDIGPVDLLCKDGAGAHVLVEIKRVGEIDSVEQLTRYLQRVSTVLGDVQGVLAAQTFKPQAKTLAADRGITCVQVDYEVLKGMESNVPTLF